jgi:xanthine dehydrogenase YagS FAD-binding subunit
VSAYVRAGSLEEAFALLAGGAARALAGGTDLVPLQARGKAAGPLVDVRALLGDGIESAGDGLVIGAATRVADVASDAVIAERYAALSQAARQAASPQLRNQGTVGGNLAQHVRCWYFRHPDLTCWLNGGDTCYAQIGEHQKHGLEPGDCISVAPSDLAGALLALAAAVRVAGADGERTLPIEQLYARPTEGHRSAVQLEPGELITAIELPAPPDASAYERAGERAAWSFALTGIAAARFGDDVRLAAIGLTNEPRLLAPADPLAGLPGLEQTGWKRELAGVLCERALARVARPS